MSTLIFEVNINRMGFPKELDAEEKTKILSRIRKHYEADKKVLAIEEVTDGLKITKDYSSKPTTV